MVGALLGLSQKDATWQSIVLTGLSLAFALIPEELPLLAAAVLAVGASSLARSSIYAKRLRAIESLAYVDALVTELREHVGPPQHVRLARRHRLRVVGVRGEIPVAAVEAADGR